MIPIDSPEFKQLITEGINPKFLQRRLEPSNFPKQKGLENGGRARYDQEIKDYFAKLEEYRKQGDNWCDYSDLGFIGEGENYLQTIWQDWEVLEKRGITHNQIAERIEQLLEESNKKRLDYYSNRIENQFSQYESNFERTGHRLHPLAEGFVYFYPNAMTIGFQTCPWECKGVFGNEYGEIIEDRTDFDISRLRDRHLAGKFEENFMEGKQNLEIKVAPLTTMTTHLINRHYFFQGIGSPYRIEPEFIIGALGLLK